MHLRISKTVWILVFGMTYATTVSAASFSGNSGSSNCNASTQNQMYQEIYDQAKSNYQNEVPQPTNISASTCFSNILDMGTTIGLSFFNPENLIKQLEQMACNAAQQALQWPMQQASNAINQYGQLPYGMGGASATYGSSNNGPITIQTPTSSAPGPSLPANNNLNALNNALG